MGESGAPEVLTRDRIIQAALELFFERGTFGASMRDLAEAAGVSVQGLYYHFDSKQDLIRAVLAHRDGVRGPSPLLPKRLADRIMVQAQAEFMAFQKDLAFNGILSTESVRRQPDAVAALMSGYEGWVSYWATHVLGDAVDIDPEADLRAAALTVTTFIWGINITYLITLDSSLIERMKPLAVYLQHSLTKSIPRPTRNAARKRS